MVYGISSVDSGYMLKTVKDMDSVTMLELTGYHKEKLPGRVFGLGEGKDLEVFVITEKSGINDYLISGKLKKNHKKGDKLLRIYRTYADSDGNYVLPVAEGTENEIKVVTKIVDT